MLHISFEVEHMQYLNEVWVSDSLQLQHAVYLTVLTYFISLHHSKGHPDPETNFVVTPCTVAKYILYYYQ